MNIIKKLNNHMELDLLALVKAMISKIWLSVILAVLCGGLMAGYTYYYKEPEYAAQISLYVNNTNNPTVISNITSSDINASYLLLQTYATVIKSETVLDDIVQLSGTEYSVEELSKMIEIDAAENTSVLLITVKCNNPEVAALLANSIAESVSNNLSKIVIGSSVRILDYARVPDKKIGPSYSKAAVLGMAIGVLLSVVIVILMSIRKKKVKSERDLTETNVPILGQIDLKTDGEEEFTEFETLKTNLIYSLPGKKCKKIAITSSTSEENKSEIAFHLAQSLFKDGSKVLLIDCDLRNSQLTEMLHLKKSPGVTEILIDAQKADDTIQLFENKIPVISSGTPSLNPISLLQSEEMGKLLERVESVFDFVIIDVPSFHDPENVIALSKYVTGIIFVVKMKVAWKNSVKEALETLKENGSNVIGLAYIKESKVKK